MAKLKLGDNASIVTIEFEGDEEKISLEEYFLIESEMRQLLQDVHMFDWNEKD